MVNNLSIPHLELKNIVLCLLFLIFGSVCVFVLFLRWKIGEGREQMGIPLGLPERSWGAVPSPLFTAVNSHVIWTSIFFFPGTVSLFPFSPLGFGLPKKGMRTFGLIANSLGTLGVYDSPFTSDNINYYLFPSCHSDPERHAGGCFSYPSCTPGPE